jgi:hypothetical protein
MFSIEMVMRHLPALHAYTAKALAEFAGQPSVNFLRCWLNLICRFRFQSFLQASVSDEVVDRIAEWQFQFIHGIALGERRHAYYARPEYVALRDEAMALFEQIARERLACENPPGDCLDAIIAKRRELEDPINMDGLKDDVYMLTVAGVDNIASFIIALLEDIIHQPGLLAEVREELDAWDGEDLQGFFQLPKLKAIVLESQRVRPQVVATTAGFLYPMEDFTFEGHEIPADTPILHPMILGQFMEEHYRSPSSLTISASSKRRVANPNSFHARMGSLEVGRIFVSVRTWVFCKGHLSSPSFCVNMTSKGCSRHPLVLVSVTVVSCTRKRCQCGCFRVVVKLIHLGYVASFHYRSKSWDRSGLDPLSRDERGSGLGLLPRATVCVGVVGDRCGISRSD